jgi:hypothetical protein
MSSLDWIAFLLAALLATLGTAKIFAVPPMRAAAAHVGFSTSAYRAIGTLELAAAVGLVVGRSFEILGIASASGVILLMIGAVMAHVRAGDGALRWLPPIAVGALAASYVAALAP